MSENCCLLPQLGCRHLCDAAGHLLHQLQPAWYLNSDYQRRIHFAAVDTSFGGTSDYSSLNGSEISGTTTIRFSRKLNTGDAYDTVIGQNGLYLIWAYGTSDGSGTTYPKHASTGSGMVYFLSQPGNATPANLTGQIIAGNSSSLQAIVKSTPQVTIGNFKAWWSINASSKVFTLTMQGNTSGWVSVGFADTPFMTNSDVVVCRDSDVIVSSRRRWAG